MAAKKSPQERNEWIVFTPGPKLLRESSVISPDVNVEIPANKKRRSDDNNPLGDFYVISFLHCSSQ